MKVSQKIFTFLSVVMFIYLMIWYAGTHSVHQYGNHVKNGDGNVSSTDDAEVNSASEGDKCVEPDCAEPTSEYEATTKLDGLYDDSIAVANEDTKIIYIWDRQPWLFSNIGPTRKSFKEAGCLFHNCRLVDAKTDPVTTVASSDSVLFTIRDFFSDVKPKRTNPDQIWVIWHNEAPLHDHPISFSVLNDYFNLTFSYMDLPETDIYRPAGGKMIPRPDNLRYNPPTLEYIHSKKRMVAWIVSNCHSKGQRTLYAKRLSKYIDVDIYGKCGMNCSREQDFCFKKVSHEYKFYLSFESMYCEQYITEKMFRPLSGFIVPIALGGANYSAVFPKHSYIDVRDFSSPEDLAKYLKYLDENDDKYMEYFEWKAKYMAVSQIPPGVCDLCEILHTPNYPYKSGFRFDEYWDPKKYCKIGRNEKEALHLK